MGGSLEVLKFMSSRGAKLSGKFPKKMTLLHAAALSGSITKMTYLMEELKFSITARDEEGNSPFDLAVGACKEYLTERKNRGFLSDTIVK